MTKASTLSIEQETDAYFLARMDHASAEERDAVFADLAQRTLAGDEVAARTIRVRMLDDGNEQNMRFEPALIRVRRGEQIRFVHADIMTSNTTLQKLKLSEIRESGSPRWIETALPVEAVEGTSLPQGRKQG